ncbi:transcription factor [Pyrenophora seminiperda CCB06]|uniref:Transcription factor n=1 Tax=Pyrenophora seminiperda CCB06 TaxID=1302712 RepID=A0A3M7LWS1_9PLEO|nr:transcription factor [Pyrenophora seminiperda CCB06]
MERPVQSFKSFVRAAPSRPGAGNDKPLPPTPFGPSLSPLSLPPLPDSPEPSLSDTSWEAPIGWDSPSQLSPSNSVFALRAYSPLISEPSPGLSNMQTESDSWPFEASALEQPQPRLYPIQEGSMTRPRTPPRHPQRLSPLQTPTNGSDPSLSTLRQAQPDFFAVSSPELLVKDLSPTPPTELRLHTTETSPANFTDRMSDASTKARAYASLGIGSPRNTKAEWDDWPDTPHADSDPSALQSFHGHKLPPLDIGPITDDNSDELNDPALSEQMQLLSFSQDYHNVLAEQYYESRVGRPGGLSGSSSKISALMGVEMPRTMRSANEYGLLPEPLAWRKELDHETPHSIHVNPPPSISPTKSHSKYSRTASWTSLRHLNNNDVRIHTHEESLPHSSSDSVVPHSKRIARKASDSPLRWDRHMPNIITHARALRLNKRRARGVDVLDTKRSPPTSSDPAPTSPIPRQRSPLIRLPGGFAMVRQSPFIAPKHEAPNVRSFSSLDNDEGHDRSQESPVSTSVSDVPWRRSSWYSQNSHTFVAPTTAINRGSRSSLGSPQSRPRSNYSSTPTSPLAHGTTLPHTPPVHNPPNVAKTPPIPTLSPSYEAQKSMPHEDADAFIEEDSLGRGIMNKARDMRDAWRRHQKAAEHDKLKQSIRILGPVDPAVAADYVKHEHGQSSGEGEQSGRRPGYMVSGSS